MKYSHYANNGRLSLLHYCLAALEFLSGFEGEFSHSGHPLLEHAQRRTTRHFLCDSIYRSPADTLLDGRLGIFKHNTEIKHPTCGRDGLKLARAW